MILRPGFMHYKGTVKRESGVAWSIACPECKSMVLLSGAGNVFDRNVFDHEASVVRCERYVDCPYCECRFTLELVEEDK